ncbi:UNVERIFIED_CONTAM: Sister chromatid cohesion protein SCC4 [Sesamum latifolium]|uniref:Sister chromatid cohesion protein SCC4 n=1 Tax=Sesamum latifolium TaxID=2727402 RepID=A0AAW2Y407_9LAMI
MEAVAEGLWALAEHHEQRREIGKAVKCLEAICQSPVSFLPIVEIKTRLRVAALLLKHSHNVNHAKAHLERSQLLLKSIPSCFELKCRAYSLLSQCYHLVGAIPSQKQILNKGLELTAISGDGYAYLEYMKLKAFYFALLCCDLNCKLAFELRFSQGYINCIRAIHCPSSYNRATGVVKLVLQHSPDARVKRDPHGPPTNSSKLVIGKGHISASSRVLSLRCLPERIVTYYYEVSMYTMRFAGGLWSCNFNSQLANALIIEGDYNGSILALQQGFSCAVEMCYPELQWDSTSLVEESVNRCNVIWESIEPDKRAWPDKLELAPPPIDGEWLPKSAVYALVDLMVVVFSRPKGLFKECQKRIQSGLQTIQGSWIWLSVTYYLPKRHEELLQLGITDRVKEVELQHSAIWMAGVYLMLLMQFLENKVAIDLTRTEFVEAQEALVQMRNWFVRFPTILQACESTIEMLRGQYAHSVGCYSEAAFHFLEASKLTQSKSTQAMSQIYAAVSFICIGDAESSAKAVDLIGPVLGVIDSFVGVREKTCALYTYGFLLMRQQNLQEARRLLSVYFLHGLGLGMEDGLALSVLGLRNLKICPDIVKKLYDIPTQNWVLSNLTALYQQSGEKGSEMENLEYQRRKIEDLQQRLAIARSSVHHNELIEKVKLQVQQLNEQDMKRAIAGPSRSIDLDIPESVGLLTPQPMPSSARLMDQDIGRLRKRKV